MLRKFALQLNDDFEQGDAIQSKFFTDLFENKISAST